MDVNKGPDGHLKASADSQAGANNQDQALLPTEDDEIPLGSSSEESESSDVSMSDSEDEGERNSLISTGNEYIPIQPTLSPAPAAAAVCGYQKSQGTSKKRKSLDQTDSLYTALSAKKVKLDEDYSQATPTASYPSDKSLLPPEIWHRIFSFVPPRALGNLLRVNKLFNAFLDPSSRYQSKFPPSPSRTSVPRMKPDAIWQLSRRRTWLRMPAPLQQKTELDMWRLACGKRCQTCGKTDLASLTSSDDERCCKSQPIWAFGIRSCGPCLVEKTISEANLLLSPSVPSLLRPALPFVLMSSEMDTISSDALQRGLIQPNLQVTKIYLSEHVEELKQEFLSVESMGGATAEEWFKGLDARGKESLNDSMRWEKWSSTGGVAQMQTQLSPDNVPGVVTASGKRLLSANVSSLAPRAHLSSNAVFGQHLPVSHPMVPIATTSQSVTHSSPATSTQNDHASQMSSYFKHGVQSNAARIRTREEAEELKAARRAEIERRAMELDPPLPATILARIPSFQAAIQIISVLDDNAWDLLKPRLLAQSADAVKIENREQENSPQSPAPQGRPEERRHCEENSRESKQIIDKTWDDVQAPLRARISAYADKIIRESWDDGHKVDMENSPQFAAEVLLHVRRRFYTEIAKEAAEARSAGQGPIEDPPEGPFTQKLTLENMKWLFDVKIKPLTESYRKDLFFCNGCEVNFKSFGFEGVIQHYAAKHTNVLSLGSVVVHWRAEWPETPPFKPDPHVIKTAQPSATLSYRALQLRDHAGIYSSAADPAAFQPPPYFPGPSFGYGHSVYGQTAQHAAPYSQGALYTPKQHEYGSLYPNPSSHAYPYPQPPFPSGIYTGPPGHPHTTAAYYGHNYNASRINSQAQLQTHHHSSPADIYHAQLEYLARSSRDLWSVTAALKGLPGEIRVCVVIHHVVQRFQSRFSERPTLDLFIDGLSNNKEMRPVRNVNGLMCEACRMGFGPFPKTYSFPQLVNHFRQSHSNQARAPNFPSLDWTVDMVHTPDLSILTKLYELANMDSQKYSLISDAFPQTRLAAGYPRGAPPISLPAAQADANVTSCASQQPTSRTPFSQLPSQHEPLLATFDPITTKRRLSMLSQHPALDQSTASSTPTPTVYPKFQQGDRDQRSSELLLSSNGTKPKRQKWDSAKDHRTTSGQGSRDHKTGVATTSAKNKSEEPSDEDLVAEEDRRQEEEIRAMWAAGRREAARLASRNQRRDPAEEPDVSTADLEVERLRRYRTQATQISEPPLHSTRAPGHRRHVDIREREEDDLMAGLVSQLDQQQVPTGDFDRRLRPVRDIQHERQPSSERRVDSRDYIDPNQGHSYNQLRDEHIVYTQYEVSPYFDRYREVSSGPRPVDPVHRSVRTQARPDDESYYSRRSHQEFLQGYGDDPGARRPVPQFAETYELVRVRDSAGEYFIRQPVRLEQEPIYVSSPRTRAFNRGAAPQHRASENDGYSGNELRYECASRTESPARRPTYERSVRPGGVTKTSLEPLYDDPAGLEDYDPRFPAAPSSSSTARRAWYESS
ncbi:hypothetical protein F5Y05DRAFT_414778 [Hypoxylon sp. FL0543]|nr:hypothetical protein F5Y05DRAFT_414778 [Hypoxylon sp. FL0543]